MYEKFYNNRAINSSTKYNATDVSESRETAGKVSVAEFELMNSYTRRSISLEADDENPFGDIGDDTGTGTDDFGGDDPFGSDDAGGETGGDPFGDIGDDTGGFDFDSADDSTGDLFGDDSGNNNQNAERERQKALLLDRAKSIKEDYDISRQIRANYPKKFLEMKNILLLNIDRMQRTILQNAEHEEVLSGMITECERLLELVETYIEVMAKKPYEDIFATYVSIHTSMLRLKNLYIKITGLEKEDIEQEEGKYSSTI